MDKRKLLELKQRCHSLKPVVILGAHGLTESVQKEIDLALESHELIKIRVNAESRAERQIMTDQICQQQRATLVSQIGHIIAIYRRSEKK